MSGDDLESRVSAVEQQVSDLSGRVQASERDAAAARVLAGAADRDVSEFRTETRDFRQATAASFNALREDFVDLHDHMDAKFTQVDHAFTGIRGTLDATAAGQQHIADLIQTLINQQE